MKRLSTHAVELVSAYSEGITELIIEQYSKPGKQKVKEIDELRKIEYIYKTARSKVCHTEI